MYMALTGGHRRSSGSFSLYLKWYSIRVIVSCLELCELDWVSQGLINCEIPDEVWIIPVEWLSWLIADLIRLYHPGVGGARTIWQSLVKPLRGQQSQAPAQVCVVDSFLENSGGRTREKMEDGSCKDARHPRWLRVFPPDLSGDDTLYLDNTNQKLEKEKQNGSLFQIKCYEQKNAMPPKDVINTPSHHHRSGLLNSSLITPWNPVPDRSRFL